MRASLRTALGAVLTTAVVLSVPVNSALATTQPADGAAAAVADRLERAFTSDEASAIFDQVQEALAPKDLPPRTLGNPLPRRDLSLLMREAQAAKGSMTARQASIIDSNGRPVPDSEGCNDFTPLLGATWEGLVSSGGNFCIHYRPSLSASAGGATLAQAQATANEMEFVYSREVTALGFNPPLSDSDGLYDVYLDQIGDQGFYGFCTTDTGSRTSSAWCGLDNDFAVNEFGAPPINSLRVTAAHEFFHAIQFGYDAGEDDWFMEGTAVWMEDQVYPAINDYLQYLRFSQIVKPRQSADFAGNLERYGAVTFWKFLSERYKDVTIIRQVWNQARVSAGSRNAIQAVATVLRAKGSTLPLEFARYGIWNTLPPGTYADRSRFPAPGAWGSGTLSRKARDTGVLNVKLNHLATAPLILRVGSTLPTRTKLRVIVDGPNTSRGTQARIQLRFKSGKVTVYTVPLNSLGNGSKVVPFNPTYLRSAIVTMSNGSTGFNGQLFKVRAKVAY